LNLQDWTITMRVVNEGDLDNGTIGDIEPNRTSKTAVIRLMHESESDLSIGWPVRISVTPSCTKWCICAGSQTAT
jgi:hypothetical protein